MTTSSFPTTSARPIDGATRIDLTFASAMSKGSGSIFVTDGAVQTVIDRLTGEPKLRVVGGSFKKEISLDQVSVSGNQVSFDAAGLPPGLALNVYMGAGALLADGKAAAAITVPGSASFTVPADAAGLSASVAVENTTLKAGGDLEVTVSFSKAVSEPFLAAITAEHASVTNLTHSADLHTWTITLGAAGSIESLSNVLRLDMSQVTAADGSRGSGTLSSAPYAVDTIVDAYIFSFLGVSDNGPSDEDGVTNDNGHFVSGVLMGALAADERIELSINGVLIDQALIHLVGEGEAWGWYYDPESDTSTFAEGSNTVTARVVKADGHSSATVSKTVVIDTDAPDIASQPGTPIDASGSISIGFDEAVYLHEGVEVINRIVAVDSFGNTSWIPVYSSMFSTDRKTLTLSAEQHDLASGNSYQFYLPGGLSDLAGNEYEGDPIAISTAGDYQDKASPRLVQIYIASGNGSYGVGDVLVFRLVFSEKVNVAAGTELLLDIESDSRLAAEYVGLVNDGTEMEFRYTVQAGIDFDVVNNVYHPYDLRGNVHDDAGNVLQSEHIEYEGLTTADGLLAVVSIDTTAATAPGAPQLHADSEANAAGTGTTTDIRPRLTGSGAEPNAAISIYIGDAKVGAASADAAGHWDTILSSALPIGSYQLTITQEDAAGNVSDRSSALPLTIESGAALVAPVLDSASDSGVSDSDRITIDDTPTIRGTGPAVTTLRLHHNGVEIGTVTTDADGNWNTTLPALAEGAHGFTVQQGDGPISPALSVTVDRSGPAASATPDLDPTSDSGSSNSDNITNDSTPTFTGSGAVAGAPVALLVDAVEVGRVLADSAGNWSLTSTVLTDGIRQVQTRYFDLAGNQAPDSAALGLTIDSAAPEASVGSLDLASGSFLLPFSETIVFTQGGQFKLFQDGAERAPYLGSDTGTWSITPDGEGELSVLNFKLALDGLLKLQWTSGSVTDLAGNAAVIVGTPEWEFTVPPTA